MSKNKKKLVDNRRNFLLSFFKEIEGYDELEVNGWWLIKQWDGNFKYWTVHLYSQESYRNYKQGIETYKNNSGGYLDDLFKNAIAKDD